MLRSYSAIWLWAISAFFHIYVTEFFTKSMPQWEQLRQYIYCNDTCFCIVQINGYMIALHELQTAQTLRLHWLKIELIVVGFSYRPFIEFSKYHFYCRFCIHFLVLLVLFVFVFFQTLSLILDNCLFVKTEILLMTLAT